MSGKNPDSTWRRIPALRQLVTALTVALAIPACTSDDPASAVPPPAGGPMPKVSVDPAAPASATEDAGTVEILVRLDRAADAEVTVEYALVTVGAVQGTDFTIGPSSPLSFPAGTTEQVVTVTVVDDDLSEATESLTLTLQNPGEGLDLGSPVAHTLSILDNDATPKVAFDATAPTAALEDAGTVDLAVRLDRATDRPVSVGYALSTAGATEGEDFSISPASPLNFAAGTTEQVLTVTVVDDALDEVAAESLTLTLQNPDGGLELGENASHTLSITDNDDTPVNPALPDVHFDDALPVTADEGAGTVTLTVVLSAASADTVTVDYATDAGSATAGEDFTLDPATQVSFAPGVTAADITVTLIDDETFEFPDETVVLALANPVNANAAAPAVHSMTIVNNDPRIWRIEDDDTRLHPESEVNLITVEELATLTALVRGVDGDTIEFGEGAFEFHTTLGMSHRDGITIRGQGLDKTILDFAGSSLPEGLSVSHMTGIHFEDFTVIDTPGFSIKVSDSEFVTMTRVRTMWSSADSDGDPENGDDRGGMDPKVPSSLDVTCNHEASFPLSNGSYVDASGAPRTYQVDSGNGGYAIYPVLSNHIVLDEVVALGASDAGIYVGQSNDAVIKNSHALFNVAGYEIENTDRADMFDNVAECNTAGFLVFDLPGLNQYGERTRIFNNEARYNNTDNFAPGGIVALVPRGIGILQLGYDFTEIFGNTIEFNSSLGFVAASHELLSGSDDLRMDYYPEGINLYGNTFTTNGTSPPPPKESAFICAAGTGEGTSLPCVPEGIDEGDASLLPALIQVKGNLAGDGYGPTGAHIIWDGMFERAGDTDLASTTRVDEKFCTELAPAFAGLVDADGKPDYDGSHNPACRYIAYKFGADNSTLDADRFEKYEDRQLPKYLMCISAAEESPASPYEANTFTADSRVFMNFENLDPTDPPDVDVTTHYCMQQFGATLPALDAAAPEAYVPGEAGEAPPTQAEIDALCEDHSGNEVNRDALGVNCTWLSQYNLFADPTDPRSGPNGGGLPFDLTTALFSDYAMKRRFVFVPPGQQAQWFEGHPGAPNDGLSFPVGTVIAKTFSFVNGADEEVVETRLLIYRDDEHGPFWEGMAYIWEKDGAGNRTDAKLAIGGGVTEAQWNFEDPDPDVDVTYVGSTDSYAIPNPLQCGNCHVNDDYQPGDAPIGTKVRLLNRPMDYGSGPINQLQHWVDLGLLAGAPDLVDADNDRIVDNAHRLPRFNVAGDVRSIPTPGDDQDRIDQMTESELDLEYRARAWLETNCAHCHNRDGLAQSTGVRLDVFREVNLGYGVCKTPTTAGSSSGGHNHDIVPGSSATSIAFYRMTTEVTGHFMPPIARSVTHDEGVAVVQQWIDGVVDGRYDSSSCAQ